MPKKPRGTVTLDDSSITRPYTDKLTPEQRERLDEAERNARAKAKKGETLAKTDTTT